VLRELAARRSQLVDALQAERCRLALAQAPSVRHSLALVIGVLEKSLTGLEAELAEHIAADPQMAHLAGLLRTVKGIGPITAATMIADLPELGHLSGKEIAALVGLAPLPDRAARPGSASELATADRLSAARSSMRPAPPSATLRPSRPSMIVSSIITSGPARSLSPPS